MTPHAALLALSALHLMAGAAPSEPVTLALIVASNRGSRPGRPALQYADDDGAKYFHVFSAIAGEGNVVLLTELDRDTARLFPELVGRVGLPTRAGVTSAGEALAHRAAQIRERGQPVRFYFVFAGHGDVEDGKGFIELPDGAFTADDLHGLLVGMGASESHVILDSCNSFFVINPRKPGGRRVATPQEAAEQMARQLSDVGVFLSTSAQGETFEWSELQSGVFSHAVRSGLLGAADADGDGRVSYLELAAFVETAAAGIKNPLYRPRLFARGPNGDSGRPIVERPPSARASLRVDEPGPVRLAWRDQEGLRWLDTYKEAGAVVRTWFPAGRDGAIEVERLEPGPTGELGPVASYRLPAAEDDEVEPVQLSLLTPVPSPLAGRGAAEVFRMLFTTPFGPRALAAFVANGGMERVGECPMEPHRAGWLEQLSVGVAAGAAFPRVHAGGPGSGSVTLEAGGDLAIRVALPLAGPSSLELELGYQRSATSQPWHSTAYWDAVLGPGYLGPREPPATRVVLEIVPVLWGLRIAPRLRWGIVPQLALTAGAALATFEVRPTEVLAGASSTAQTWAGALQGGVGVMVELPRGFKAGLDARALRLLSPVQVYGVHFEVTALRTDVVLAWGSTSTLRGR